MPNTNKRPNTWSARKFFSQLRKVKLKKRRVIVGQKHNMFKEWRKEEPRPEEALKDDTRIRSEDRTISTPNPKRS